MINRDTHVGKSDIDISQYGKKIKSTEGEDQTYPEEYVDPLATATPELKKELGELKIRPRLIRKNIYGKITDNLWLVFNGLFIAIFSSLIVALFVLYSNLNKDLGKIDERTRNIEERTKNIPDLLMSIDKRIELIQLDMKRDRELYNYKLEELNNKFEKIKSEKQN